MTAPLELSRSALDFIGGTGPVLPAGVLEALGLPEPGELYREDSTGQGGNAGPLFPAGSGPAAAATMSGVVGELADRASTEMGRVLRHPEGGRELAFRLLAADALLTWACEAAADADQPAGELHRVIAALAHPAR